MVKNGKSKKNTVDPYLTAAIICEKILIEADGSATAIRIADIINIPAEQNLPLGEIVALPLCLLILIKSGDFRGQKSLAIRAINPSGQREESISMPLTFTDPPEGGQQVRSPVIPLKWDGAGLYIFEIVLDDKVYGRVPLRVNVLPKEPSEATNPPEEKPRTSKRGRRV
jgi:hypothetical protein